MLVPKPIRRRVYMNLFNNGVVVAKKDFMNKHHEMKDIPNLMVVKLMQSMVSRELVKEQFNWGWYYFFLKV
jgi:small subunit ribosomal protein S10e